MNPWLLNRRDARVSINPFPPSQAIYVSTSSGLQVSTDGGVTWNPVLANRFPIISLQFGTTDATQLFAATGNPPAAYEAQNGGLSPASWHKLQGCPQAPLPSFPSDASEWITESQGTQSIQLSPRHEHPIAPSLGLWRGASEICKIDGFLEHGWEPVTIPVTIPPTCSDYTNCWSYLFAHPTDPTVVFKGGIKLCRSSGSGDNMTELSGIHDDQHAVWWLRRRRRPSCSSAVMAGIYRSSDKGATLTFIGEGMYNTEVLNIDVNGAGPPRVIVGGSQDNDFFAWDGSSPVWTDVGAALSSGDVPLIVFDRKDHKGVYVIGTTRSRSRTILPAAILNSRNAAACRIATPTRSFPGRSSRAWNRPASLRRCW